MDDHGSNWTVHYRLKMKRIAVIPLDGPSIFMHSFTLRPNLKEMADRQVVKESLIGSYFVLIMVSSSRL